MPIVLDPQTEARLREKADREGQDINTFTSQLLNTFLEWDDQDYAEAVAGIQRGLDDFAQGRYRPFSQFAAEQRARHNLLSAQQETP